MVEIRHNAVVVLDALAPETITAVIPKSRILSRTAQGGSVAIHWGYDEARVLTNLGYKVPSPMLRDYEFPGPFRPYDHQINTAGFFTMNPRCFCFNEMGCGKTASAVWASDYLMRLGQRRRVLIVAPVSVLYDTWRKEWFQLLPHLRVEVAYGSAEARRAAFASTAPVVITNHDSVKFYAQDIAAGGFDLLIVDECNAFKNDASDRWVFLKNLLTPTTGLWMMTGTPASQSPLDAYALAKLVSPSRVPKSRYMWREHVMRKITSFKWVPKTDARTRVFDALQPAIRYTKSDCPDLKLPPIVFGTRRVELTPQQKKYYKQLIKEQIVVGGASITPANGAVLMTKLLQIACGAVNTDVDDTYMEFDCSSRINEVISIIEETENKVLIAIPFIRAMQLVRTALAKKFGADQVAYIDGSVPATKRADIFSAFQNTERPRILLLQPQAAAHGITLTRADVTIWYAPTTSYELFAQLNARMDRPGQVNSMTVIQLEGCDVEVRLNQALRDRKLNNEILLDMLRHLT